MQRSTNYKTQSRIEKNENNKIHIEKMEDYKGEEEGDWKYKNI